MRSHELAKLLLSKPDAEVTTSTDVSDVDDHQSTARVFGRGIHEVIFPRYGDITICIDEESVNDDAIDVMCRRNVSGEQSLKLVTNLKRRGYYVEDTEDVVDATVNHLARQKMEVEDWTTRAAIIATGMDRLMNVSKELLAAHDQAMKNPKPHRNCWHDHSESFMGSGQECQGCMHEGVRSRADSAMKNALTVPEGLDTAASHKIHQLIHETTIFRSLLDHVRAGHWSLVDAILQETLKNPRDYELIRVLMEDEANALPVP